jgi:hypothetical protein
MEMSQGKLRLMHAVAANVSVKFGQLSHGYAVQLLSGTPTRKGAHEHRPIITSPGQRLPIRK